MMLTKFEYPISRTYQLKWFPWAVYAGGLCALVLFSLLNFAANGYILTVLYTSDYNGTIATKTWSEKLSFNDRVVATCQSQSLPVHSQFYTDKLALIYDLENIWLEGDKQARVKTLPSLQYANNPLRNCSVPLLQLDMNLDDGRSAAQIGWTPWGLNAFARVTCFVDNERMTKINLTTSYEFVTSTIESGAAAQFVQSPDEHEHSVLWWGESLLSWYWMNLVRSMEGNRTRGSTTSGERQVLKGSIAYEPSGDTIDTTSLEFFKPNYHFTSNLDTDNDRHCCIHPGDNRNNRSGELHHKKVFPDIWIEADSFAKVFYSVLLADLGQQDPNSILSNSTSLSLFSKNITRMIHTAQTPFLKAGPARAPYEEKDRPNGNYIITPSVFFTEYLCQVPKLKSAASLIIAVLVADLVFLNAAWKLLNWFTVAALERSDETANYCQGCIRNGSDLGLVEMKDGVGVQTTGYEPVSSEAVGH